MADSIMPIIDQLELPIRQVSVSGPGVDALERRKEDNNNARIEGPELTQNFRAVRADLMSGLRTVLSAQ